MDACPTSESAVLSRSVDLPLYSIGRSSRVCRGGPGAEVICAGFVVGSARFRPIESEELKWSGWRCPDRWGCVDPAFSSLPRDSCSRDEASAPACTPSRCEASTRRARPRTRRRTDSGSRCTPTRLHALRRRHARCPRPRQPRHTRGPSGTTKRRVHLVTISRTPTVTERTVVQGPDGVREDLVTVLGDVATMRNEERRTIQGEPPPRPLPLPTGDVGRLGVHQQAIEVEDHCTH